MPVKKILQPGDSLMDAYKVRTQVFVEEQGFSAEIEADKNDALAYHVVFYQGDEPVATARTFADPERPGQFIIGRVAVIKALRKTGLGAELMAALEAVARQQGAVTAHLGAQCRAAGFYEKCGYTVCGEEYDDEGCPHMPMEKLL